MPLWSFSGHASTDEDKAILKKGLHPVTTPEGKVEAREYQHGTDSTGEPNGTTHDQS